MGCRLLNTDTTDGQLLKKSISCEVWNSPPQPQFGSLSLFPLIESGKKTKVHICPQIAAGMMLQKMGDDGGEPAMDTCTCCRVNPLDAQVIIKESL